MTLYPPEEIERIIKKAHKIEYDEYCTEARPAALHILNYLRGNISHPARAMGVITDALISLAVTLRITPEDFQEMQDLVSTNYKDIWSKEASNPK
jgi:hypothetical protein